MSLWRPGQDQLTQKEVEAIRASALEATDQVAKKSEVDAKVSIADFQAFLDVLDWQNSVISPVQYYKATAPTGTGASEGELCLCADGKIYEFTGGAWDTGTSLSDGDRFWHYETGTDDSGDSGTHTASNKLYEWDGESLLDDSPTFGTIASVESEGEFYWYDGVIVKKFSSSQLTANEVAAIQAANFAPGDVVAKTSDILSVAEEANFKNGIYVGCNVADSRVVSLNHFNGSAGQTTFTDENPSVSWQRIGGSSLSQTYKKFGTASIWCGGVGGGGCFGVNENFVIGENSFTVDFWLYVYNYGSAKTFFALGGTSGLRLYNASQTLYISIDGVEKGSFSTTLNWEHIAIVGGENEIKIYQNGILKITIGEAYSFSHNTVYLGGTSTSDFAGVYIDEFRFYNGYAVWSSNFTPPTAAYTNAIEGSIRLQDPNSSATLALTYTKLAAIFAHVGI